MALRFTGGQHHLTELDLGGQQIDVDGATVYMNRVTCGDVNVIDGRLFVYSSRVRDVTMSALSGNRIHATGFAARVLTLNGGQANQQVILSKTEITRNVVSTGTFDIWNADLLVDSSLATDYAVNISGLTGFDLKLHVNRANRNALRLNDSVAGEVYATIIDPSVQTNDGFSGILLEGTSDQLDIRGSVRGAIRQANGPEYGIQVGASCTAIDLWLAISGAVTGDINDLTTGEVTVH